VSLPRHRHLVATHNPASKKPSPMSTGVLVVSQITYRDKIASTPMARRVIIRIGTHRGLS